MIYIHKMLIAIIVLTLTLQKVVHIELNSCLIVLSYHATFLLFYLQDLCVNDYTVFPSCRTDDSICNPVAVSMNETGQ